jgi:hypothetical protein
VFQTRSARNWCKGRHIHGHRDVYPIASP